jgi:hypothetical protein
MYGQITHKKITSKVATPWNRFMINFILTDGFIDSLCEEKKFGSHALGDGSSNNEALKLVFAFSCSIE